MIHWQQRHQQLQDCHLCTFKYFCCTFYSFKLFCTVKKRQNCEILKLFLIDLVRVMQNLLTSVCTALGKICTDRLVTSINCEGGNTGSFSSFKS